MGGRYTTNHYVQLFLAPSRWASQAQILLITFLCRPGVAWRARIRMTLLTDISVLPRRLIQIDCPVPIQCYNLSRLLYRLCQPSKCKFKIVHVKFTWLTDTADGKVDSSHAQEWTVYLYLLSLVLPTELEMHISPRKSLTLFTTKSTMTGFNNGSN